jgi:glycosyltransferase involved in cell wall biosynthesis
MKILQIGKYYPPVKGGMESVLRDLCEGLLDAGHEVTALVANLGSEDVHERLAGRGELVRCGTTGVLASQPLTLSLLHHLRRVLCQEQPDVVQIHVPNPLGAACLLALKDSCPEHTVVTVWHHADVARQRVGRHLVRPLSRALLKMCDGVCVSSDALKASSTELAPCRDDVATIPFGLDPERWNIQRNSAGEELLFVGRLVYYKGLDLLLDAMKQVPDARLTIVGDGPLREHLADRIRIENLADRITLAGEVSDDEVKTLFSHARALVLPSDHSSETFGVVQLEAMAARLPVLSTSLGTGVAGVNVHETTGLQVPPGDGAALAAAITRIINEPENCLEWGRSGQARVVECFHRDNMVNALLSWYEDLHQKNRAKRSS